MARRAMLPGLSAREMEWMELLWEQGPLTLAEAHERLGRGIGYTTAQTQLNRLVKKGAVSRSDDRPARYTAAVHAERVRKSQISTLVERFRGLGLVPLVAHLVQDESLTASELAELKQLIAAAERRLSSTTEQQP
ncbi:MAG TPA: BlaI/MecI/CopY family transcriptional regulator [Planctomycetaceae bacterium]|nr:BlaI/MecI/CopY family transcriptional regulator [Planctomycetaceae bacterium]